MSGGRNGDSEFRRALTGVKPLKDDRLRPEPKPQLDPRVREAEGPPVRFEIERVGERIAGRAPDTDRRHLARLKRGEIPPDCELDLHGMNAQAAERAVREALTEAIARGQRCLLVIHGRGRRSADEAVLKETLPDWLAARPHGPRILAFASATGRGGAGATCVLLRRKR